MDERFPNILPHSTPVEAAPDPQIEAAVAQASTFISDVAPNLGRMFGMDLDISIGNGWATDMESGKVTVDPRFFVEKGYTPDMSVYATLHEIRAHLMEVRTEPALTARVIRFCRKGKPEDIFHNILSDVAGNNRIHAVLPNMADVAAELYDKKLFRTVDEETGETRDYSNTREYPRHLQFLYKIVRDEMIPGSETAVQPEVDEALGRLRDYQGKGDAIKYTTEAPKRKGAQLSPTQRFEAWTAIIYPEFQQLLELDRQDPEAGADRQPDEGDGEGQSGENQPSDQNDENDQTSQRRGSGKARGRPDDKFEGAYEDYRQNMHPEPLSDEEQKKVTETAKERAKEAQKKIDPKQAHDKLLRATTGYGLVDHRKYQAEVAKHADAIDRMRDVFRGVINERIALKRQLSHTAYTEGDLLDPNRLTQTIIDRKSGTPDPEAYVRYERSKGQTTATGNTDYIFLYDRSTSMDTDDRNESAAASALIMTEGLSAMQRDVRAAEEEYDMDLELDIRTALYVFDDKATCIKPLGNNLTDKDRVTIYNETKNTQGTTKDFLAMEEIADIPMESGRQRILIEVSDGDSDDIERKEAALQKLRQQGVHIYDIRIDGGTNGPDTKSIDDPSKLPEVLEEFIEGTLR